MRGNMIKRDRVKDEFEEGVLFSSLRQTPSKFLSTQDKRAAPPAASSSLQIKYRLLSTAMGARKYGREIFQAGTAASMTGIRCA